MAKWQIALKQVAMDWYRGAWQSPLCLSEAARYTMRKHRDEASYATMAHYFAQQCKTWHEFYSDKETVRSLMACSH